MRKFAIAILSLVAVAGCATTPTWQAVDSNRSNGTVQLAFDYGLLNPPAVEQAQALSTAVSQCRGWGYSSAQLASETGSRCSAMNSYAQCVRVTLYQRYQCTGGDGPTTI